MNPTQEGRDTVDKPGQQISIPVLRKFINDVLDFVETDLGLTNVSLKQNYYWSVADNALYAMADQPKELAVGSLDADWDFLLSAARSADQQIPIMLIHVAPLLQALSQAVPSYTSPGGASK